MEYKSRCAKDAQEMGFEKTYCDYLEESSTRHANYYKDRCLPQKADEMMTRTYCESLIGNDGD